MRLKVLSMFLGIQLLSFALWQGVEAWGAKAAFGMPGVTAPIHEAANQKGGNIHFSAKIDDRHYGVVASEQEKEMKAVIAKLPANHMDGLKNLILDMNPEAQRGLGGRDLIILKGVGVAAPELAAVMIHEIGHHLDLGVLNEKETVSSSEFKDGEKAIYEGDPSLEFYRLSWQNEKLRKKGMANFDFVSGYAMTDPFEDFAETYAYYVLHNRDFQAKAQNRPILSQKYDFMRRVVFKGKVFDTGASKPESLNRVPWDVTVLNYDLEGFLKG